MKPSSGYAFKCSAKNFRTPKDEAWDTVVLDPKKDGPFTLVGRRLIDGTWHNVWCGDGGFYAQVARG